jgi:hypothetical protein
VGCYVAGQFLGEVISYHYKYSRNIPIPHNHYGYTTLNQRTGFYSVIFLSFYPLLPIDGVHTVLLLPTGLVVTAYFTLITNARNLEAAIYWVSVLCFIVIQPPTR